MFNHKVGDIISIRVKIKSKTEEENGKMTYVVKGLNEGYHSMTINEEDIVGTSAIIPTELEDMK